jgi:hypothetical protein
MEEYLFVPCLHILKYVHPSLNCEFPMYGTRIVQGKLLFPPLLKIAAQFD